MLFFRMKACVETKAGRSRAGYEWRIRVEYSVEPSHFTSAVSVVPLGDADAATAELIGFGPSAVP